MAFLRTVSQGIADLNSPQMGGVFPSGVNQNPASFNDAVNQIIGIDQLGWVSAQGMGANVGGAYKPLVGDWGKTFTHSQPLTYQVTVGLPQNLTKYCLIIHAKVIATDHTMRARIYNGVNFQGLMPTSGTALLGTGPNQHLFSATLATNIVSINGQVEDRILEFVIDKGSQSGNAANSGDHKYWDGLWAFTLKFWK